MQMLKRSIRLLLNRFGYQIQRQVSFNRQKSDASEEFKGYELHKEALENIRLISLNTMVPPVRLITLYQQVVFCEVTQLKGSFVECGTWKGGAVGLMARGNLLYGSARRDIHLFDSFVGIPEPDEKHDDENAIKFARNAGGDTKGRLVPLEGTYSSIGTLEDNRALLEGTIRYDPLYLHYHQGWFQDTLPEVSREIDQIAILRLDGDWYASTKICLEHLYDKVVSGGFIIIDDYGYNDGCKKAVNEFLIKLPRKPFLNHIDVEGRYWIKP